VFGRSFSERGTNEIEQRIADTSMPPSFDPVCPFDEDQDRRLEYLPSSAWTARITTNSEQSSGGSTALGEKVKKLRKGKRLSQEALAQQVGINSNHLGRLEGGVFHFSMEILKRFA
jgi:DNA-binding XRE family transcriptional regulator